MIVGGAGGDLDPAYWQEWIMRYKGWTTQDEWKQLYDPWKAALGDDPGNNPARLVAANKVLDSFDIRIFTWGANSWKGALDNADKVSTAAMIHELSATMQGMEDITLVGLCKGANLIMLYVNALAAGQDLVNPKNFVLISPPLGGIASVLAPRFGLHDAGNTVPPPFGPANVVHLEAYDDPYCGGKSLGNARNIHEGISGHGPHGLFAAWHVYEWLQVQFDHGSGYKPPQRSWPR